MRSWPWLQQIARWVGHCQVGLRWRRDSSGAPAVQQHHQGCFRSVLQAPEARLELQRAGSDVAVLEVARPWPRAVHNKLSGTGRTLGRSQLPHVWTRSLNFLGTLA